VCELTISQAVALITQRLGKKMYPQDLYKINSPKFWSSFSGLIDADRHIAVKNQKTDQCVLTISGEYIRLNPFLKLGFKIGQPFSLTRNSKKGLRIIWANQH
jgi:hypothetical protein